MSSPNESSEQNESAPHLQAVPEATQSTADAKSAPAEAEEDRVSRKLFLGLLVAFGVAAIGFMVQSQRIGGFETTIGGLEQELVNVSGELAAANERLESFEQQREQIQRSVGVMVEDVLALEALVAGTGPEAAPSAPETPRAPQDVINDTEGL